MRDPMNFEAMAGIGVGMSKLFVFAWKPTSLEAKTKSWLEIFGAYGLNLYTTRKYPAVHSHHGSNDLGRTVRLNAPKHPLHDFSLGRQSAARTLFSARSHLLSRSPASAGPAEKRTGGVEMHDACKLKSFGPDTGRKGKVRMRSTIMILTSSDPACHHRFPEGFGSQCTASIAYFSPFSLFLFRSRAPPLPVR